MCKRVSACILAVIVLLCPFLSISASADITSELLEWALEWLVDTSIDVGYGDWDADDLIDWYNSAEGQFYLGQMIANPGFAGMGALLDGYVTDANNHRYQVAQLKRDNIDLLYTTLNDYWSNDSAPVRNTVISDFGLSTSASIHSSWGYISGIGSYLSYWYDTNRMFYNPGTVSDTAVYLYNGSIYLPPIIYVPVDGLMFHNGYILQPGLYVLLNSDELLYIRYLGSHCFLYETPSETDVTLYLFDGRSVSYPQLVSNGVYSDINNDDISGYDVADKLRKAIGLHVCIDKSEPIEQPDDIPYDDGGNVTVLVPIDEPAQPVYLSPTTYNNYIDNGTYTTINEGDVTNNVVTDEQVTNFTNTYISYITNNYNSGGDGNSYDDTNLLNKLSNWFSSVLDKLDDIIAKLPPSNNNPSTTVIVTDSDGGSDSYSDSDSDSDSDSYVTSTDDVPYGSWLPPWLSWLDPKPCYNKFSDCFFNNLPILSLAKDTINLVNAGLSSSEDNDSKAGALSGSSSDGVSDSDVSLDDQLSITTYIDPYRKSIRSVTSVVAYALGIISVWRSVKSVFGIDIDVSDGGAIASAFGSVFGKGR